MKALSRSGFVMGSWIAAVACAILLPAALHAQGRPSFMARKLNELNPVDWARTARTNYESGTWIARDLSRHTSFRQALGQSLMPRDGAANRASVGALKGHSLSLLQAMFRPAIIELQRQAGAGKGFDGKALVHAMHPVPVATTYAASWAGAVGGAWVQSSLTAFGPAGAALGIFARPIGGLGGAMLGYAAGKNLVDGKNFWQVLKDSFADLDPARDGGNIIGSTIGGILGQTLIPVPVVGGMIGSLIGGTIGIALGDWVGSWLRGNRNIAAAPPQPREPATAAAGRGPTLLGVESGSAQEPGD